MNRWKIPDWLEKEVTMRDKYCVYCHVRLSASKRLTKSSASWEHIINDAKIINRENIARCCFSCNSSKGSKKLCDWFKSNYCKKLGINKDSVAEVVKGRCRS